MNDKGEPVRWITVKGARIPVFADGSIGVGTKEDEIPAIKDTSKFITDERYTKELYRQSKDGWTFAKDFTGNLWIGNIHNKEIFESAKDTPENRKRLNGVWESNNFSKEIKEGKKKK